MRWLRPAELNLLCFCYSLENTKVDGVDSVRFNAAAFAPPDFRFIKMAFVDRLIDRQKSFLQINILPAKRQQFTDPGFRHWPVGSGQHVTKNRRLQSSESRVGGR